MQLHYRQNVFVAACTFDQRRIPKEAGFRWHPLQKTWYTPDLSVAAKLSAYAVGDAKERLAQVFINITPWTSPLPAPPKGLSLLPHQEIAIKFALERNRCYLGLDMGLGKTACAATISRVLGKPVLYVSPPFLQQNVREEFDRWGASAVAIVADSILSNPRVSTTVEAVLSTGADTIFIDEAHRFKNQDAKRTKALLRILDRFPRHIYLSGTPMPNRPIELFTILNKSAPEVIGFRKYFDYGRHYCAGHRNDYGWDFSGASNMAELRKALVAPEGKFMLRMRKEDVLDLPPKIEEIFTITGAMSKAARKLDQSLNAYIDDDGDIMKELLAVNAGKNDLHVAEYRRLLGMEKVEPAVDIIDDVLIETDENVIVFAHHKGVIKQLECLLKQYNPLVITGETPTADRQNIVKQFQDGETRIIIGNYQAMGVGFTLTQATRVVFVEFDWVPGVNDQAADRAHRIGQDKTVLVQYLVYKNSIDKKVIETLLKKRKTINRLLQE